MIVLHAVTSEMGEKSSASHTYEVLALVPLFGICEIVHEFTAYDEYCPWFLACPLLTECAVDLIESTEKTFEESVGYNTALLRACHLPSISAFENIAAACHRKFLP